MPPGERVHMEMRKGRGIAPRPEAFERIINLRALRMKHGHPGQNRETGKNEL